MRLKFHGHVPEEGKIFERPIPLRNKSSLKRGDAVRIDPVTHEGEFTVEEANYLLGLGGAFTRVEVTSPETVSSVPNNEVNGNPGPVQAKPKPKRKPRPRKKGVSNDTSSDSGGVHTN